jgi:hypothetical protein
MTRYLSEGTTDYTSDVSISGQLAVRGVPSLASVTQTTVVLTASANSSIDTTFAMTGATVGDGIVAAAPSALSGDLSYNAWVSAADTVTLRLSNCSTVDNVQTAQTWTFYRLNAIV